MLVALLGDGRIGFDMTFKEHRFELWKIQSDMAEVLGVYTQLSCSDGDL